MYSFQHVANLWMRTLWMVKVTDQHHRMSDRSSEGRIHTLEAPGRSSQAIVHQTLAKSGAITMLGARSQPAAERSSSSEKEEVAYLCLLDFPLSFSPGSRHVSHSLPRRIRGPQLHIHSTLIPLRLRNFWGRARWQGYGIEMVQLK